MVTSNSSKRSSTPSLRSLRSMRSLRSQKSGSRNSRSVRDLLNGASQPLDPESSKASSAIDPNSEPLPGPEVPPRAEEDSPRYVRMQSQQWRQTTINKAAIMTYPQAAKDPGAEPIPWTFAGPIVKTLGPSSVAPAPLVEDSSTPVAPDTTNAVVAARDSISSDLDCQPTTSQAAAAADHLKAKLTSQSSISQLVRRRPSIETIPSPGNPFMKSTRLVDPSRRPSLSMPPQLDMIGQRSAVDFFSTSPSKRSKWMIDPDSSFRRGWDILQVVFLIYTVLFVPFTSSFFTHEHYLTHWSRKVDRASDCFYMIDVILNFHTPFYDVTSGELVYNRFLIARKYLLGWFWFDVTMSIPWDLFIDSKQVSLSATKMPRILRIARISKVAKLIRVLRLDRIIEFVEDQIGMSRNHFVVTQLLLTTLLVAHFTACGFYLVGTLNDNYETKSWIETQNLLNVSRTEAYMTSLYWSFTVMATVGFGDITPMTYTERVFAIFAMVVSAGTYAFMIASISATVSSLNVTKRKYYEKLNEINAYMVSRELPNALQLRTRKYYRYYLQRKTVYNEKEILDELPANLREEITDNFVKQTIRNVHFFHDLSKGFTSSIVMYLRPVFHTVGTVILTHGEVASEFFIMTNGVVEVYDTDVVTKKDQCIAFLYEGDFFGEMGLLIEEQQGTRSANIRVTQFCELYSLDYVMLEKALIRYNGALTKLMQTALGRKRLTSNLRKSKVTTLVRDIHKGRHMSKGQLVVANTGKGAPLQALFSRFKSKSGRSMLGK